MSEEGLGDIIVGAHVHSLNFVFQAVPAGNHNDRDLRQLTNLRTGVKSIHARQSNVQQYQDRAFLGYNFYGIFSVANHLYCVTFFFKDHTFQPQGGSVVFDQENKAIFRLTTLRVAGNFARLQEEYLPLAHCGYHAGLRCITLHCPNYGPVAYKAVITFLPENLTIRSQAGG